MVKEFRTRKFGRLHWLIRLVAAAGIISLMLTVVASNGNGQLGCRPNRIVDGAHASRLATPVRSKF